MNLEKTNFSRRYRPAQFSDFVEQELIVRMLKNSIFQNHIFPVYLFSGQRGCGKTTLARLFASALNCKERTAFEASPHSIILPCGLCDSCIAAQQGKHPDICEIDAASYTGVDHIRVLTESASFLPILGVAKVYIIDEAHMLSKASFNALLKLLEEPPTTFVCLLITTDVEKIIPTVRSRAFQLLMRPLTASGIFSLLERICKKEKILYETDALERIAQKASGSGRDALNLMEQVFRSNETINLETVRKIQGEIEDTVIDQLLSIVFKQESAAEIAAFLESHQEISRTPHAVWYQLCVAVKNVVIKKDLLHDSNKAFELMKHIYGHELGFLKTVHQYEYLEMVLLTADVSFKTIDSSENNLSAKSPFIKKIVPAETKIISPVKTTSSETDFLSVWSQFIEKLKETKDQLMLSIFEQARFEETYTKTSNKVVLLFDKDMNFLQDLLEQKKSTWAPLLTMLFEKELSIEPRFVLNSSTKSLPNELNTQPKKPSFTREPLKVLNPSKTAGRDANLKPLNLSAEAQKLLQKFPGTVTTIQDNE